MTVTPPPVPLSKFVEPAASSMPPPVIDFPDTDKIEVGISFKAAVYGDTLLLKELPFPTLIATLPALCESELEVSSTRCPVCPYLLGPEEKKMFPLEAAAVASAVFS